MQSYGTHWKPMESPTSFYIILRHSRVVWSMHDVRDMWASVECSRRFWVVVQGEKERKKINEVRHLPERGHDIEVTWECLLRKYSNLPYKWIHNCEVLVSSRLDLAWTIEGPAI